MKPGIRRGAVDGIADGSVPAVRRFELEPSVSALGLFVAARRRLVLALALAVYAGVSLAAAVRRPLWNDELFTLHIADAPTFGAIWDVLLTGVEQTPPGFHLTVAAMIDVFGTEPLALRLPSLVGVGVMAVFLYLFVARRMGALAGIVAFLFPLATVAHKYSYEARPYAVVLGLAAIALYCWQSYTMRRRPRLALTGLVLALAACVGISYYGVLVALPIAAGEATRAIEARRFDLPVWLALAAAALPLIAFVPLIEAGMSFATSFWAEPSWLLMGGFYWWLLPIATLVLVVLAVAGTGLVARRRTLAGERLRDESGPMLPRYELATAGGFLLLPVVAVIGAMLVTGAYTPRYTLPAVIGLAVLAPASAAYVDRGREIATVFLCGLLVCLAAGVMVADYLGAESERDERSRKLSFLEASAPAAGNVVVADPHSFLELAHSAPDDLSERLVYLADPGRALRFAGTDSVDLGLEGLAPYAGVEVEPYGSYTAKHDRLSVLASHSSWSWVLRGLRDDGASIDSRASDGGLSLLEVRLAG